MTTDRITTIVGCVAAAATAAQPALNAVNGSMHQGDYFALVSAVLMSVWGFFTNKAPAAK